MNRFMLIVFVLCLTLFARTETALATSAKCNYTALGKYHFSGIAFGKVVKSVAAHSGYVLKDKNSDADAFWVDIRHVRLEQDEHSNDFSGKALLETGNIFVEQQAVLGVTVQYWVEFEDGSRLITDPFLLPMIEQKTYMPSTADKYNDALDDLKEDRFSNSPLWRSEAREISFCYAS